MARTREARPAAVQSWSVLLLAGGSVGAACLAFEPFYTGRSWLPPMLGAVALGAALALLSAVRRWPAWALPPAALVVLAAYNFSLRGLADSEGVRAAADDLLSGWARALTVALPADPGPDLLAFPVAVTFIAAVLACSLVLRTTVVVGLCVPAVGVLLVAVALTAGQNNSPMVAETGLLLAVLLVLVLVRSNPSGAADDDVSAGATRGEGVALAVKSRRSTVGTVLFGLPGAAVVVLLACAGAMSLPIATGVDRADPRALVKPAVTIATGLSPLVDLTPQLADTAKSPVFTVRVTGAGAASVDRIRIAALDRFNGALWSQSGTFVPGGTELPRTAATSAESQRVALRVKPLSPARGRFLPVVGRPLGIVRTKAMPQVMIEERSGTLIRAAGKNVSSGEASYVVESTIVPKPGTTTEGAANEPALTTLGDEPTWVSEQQLRAQSKAKGNELSAWGRLTLLEDYLGGPEFAIDRGAAPGHSYGATRHVLEDTKTGGVEQYASAFAILARSMGYPSRIAVGYLLDPKNKKAGEFTVSTANAYAWPEVEFETYGWVAFDPIPTKIGQSPSSDPDHGKLIQRVIDEVPPTDGTADGGGNAIAVTNMSDTLVMVGVALLVAGLASMVGICAAKILRRSRRRRAGPPASRITAAWQETIDRLRELGYPVSRHRTPAEIVRDTQFGQASAVLNELAELAIIATAAVYAPSAPTGAASRRAWRLEGDIRRHLDAQVPLTRRMLAWVDPRPLLVRWVRVQRQERVRGRPVVVDSDRSG